MDTEKGSRSRLTVGTQLSREKMLHLALMSSENRAAHVLGRSYPGGLDAFVAAMNDKAQALGMVDTRYVEPTGLSSKNQSSARDLATLVNAAHQHQIIRELSTSPEYQVEVGRRELTFRNTNGLVRSPSWDIGLQKTGYISEAGRCLVMQAQMAGPQADHGVPRFGGQVLAHRRRRAGSPLDHRERRPLRDRCAPSTTPELAIRAPRASRRPVQAVRAGLSRDGRAWPRSAPAICFKSLDPGLFEAIGRGRDRQAGDELALIVEDAGGHAAHAEFEFLVVARDAALPHLGQLAFERGNSVMLLRVCPARPVRVA